MGADPQPVCLAPNPTLISIAHKHPIGLGTWTPGYKILVLPLAATCGPDDGKGLARLFHAVRSCSGHSESSEAKMQSFAFWDSQILTIASRVLESCHPHIL